MQDPVILPISNQPGFYCFYCPGCECSHRINIDPANAGPCWTLSGPPESPTVRASVLVRGWQYRKSTDKDEPVVCHSFVTAGRIEYLTDCTHALAGQTVDMQPY